MSAANPPAHPVMTHGTLRVRIGAANHHTYADASVIGGPAIVEVLSDSTYGATA